MKKNFINLLCIMIICQTHAMAQTILNGSFENNSAITDQINLTNPQFNSMMANCTGFGSFGDIDIITTNTYCGLAQDGNWYIAFTGSGTDMVAMELSQPLVQGNTYTLNFYDRGCNAWIPYPFDIGLSTSNTSFGDTVLFATAIPVFGTWTQRTVTFVAPNNGQFLTITMNAGGTSDWAHVDNFVLLPVAFNDHTCFGDSTIFTITNQGNLAGVQWNFDDTASGINNTSSVFNASHLFTAPGTYNVQLIQYNLNGSADTIYSSVTIYSYPPVNLGNDTTYCTGTTAILTAVGGFTSYLWQDASTDSTFSASQSGSYFVTVSNNGCSSTDTIVLQFNPCSVPGINFASSDTNFCEKSCLDFFDLSTNNPTSWQWFFPGAVPDTSTIQNPVGICYNGYGNFSVTLIACNGSGCDSLTINQFINELQNPVDSIWSSNDTLYSLPFPSYQWYEVTSGLISGATSQYFVPTQSGSYYCVVNDTIGCVGTSNTIALTGLQSEITPKAWGSQFTINPNPNNGSFEIVLNNINIIPGNATISVVNTLGQVLFLSKLNEQVSRYSIPNLENGIYSISLTSCNSIITKRLIVFR